MYVLEIHVSEIFNFMLGKYSSWVKIENCYKSPDKTEYESFLFYPNLTKEQAQELWDNDYLISEE